VQCPLGANHVSYFYVGQSHVFPAFAEGGVFVYCHNLRLLIAGSLNGDPELMDGSDFSHDPRLAEGVTGLADFVGVDVDQKNSAYCFGFGIDYSGGHQHISHVYIAGLDGLPILHQARIGTVENLIRVPLIGADGEAAGTSRGHRSANTVAPAEGLTHAIALLGKAHRSPHKQERYNHNYEPYHGFHRTI
jgi:hypothetical protein